MMQRNYLQPRPPKYFYKVAERFFSHVEGKDGYGLPYVSVFEHVLYNTPYHSEDTFLVVSVIPDIEKVFAQIVEEKITSNKKLAFRNTVMPDAIAYLCNEKYENFAVFNADFSHMPFPETRYYKVYFANCDFSHCNFDGSACFETCFFWKCNFSNNKLLLKTGQKSAVFSDCAILKCNGARSFVNEYWDMFSGCRVRSQFWI